MTEESLQITLCLHLSPLCTLIIPCTKKKSNCFFKKQLWKNRKNRGIIAFFFSLPNPRLHFVSQFEVFPANTVEFTHPPRPNDPDFRKVQVSSATGHQKTGAEKFCTGCICMDPTDQWGLVPSPRR